MARIAQRSTKTAGTGKVPAGVGGRYPSASAEGQFRDNDICGTSAYTDKFAPTDAKLTRQRHQMAGGDPSPGRKGG